MSYEIYYDRAFICVEDKFVPLVNQGSNNTWETNLFGRQVPEKNWQVLNWRDRSKLLYPENEVRNIAKDYGRISEENGMCFKTRNRSFVPGEFERWILCGLKSAYTAEEYISFGNSMFILDYSTGEPSDWETYPFRTTVEFKSLLDKLAGRSHLNIQFVNNRTLSRPKRQKQSIRYHDLNEYYVLCRTTYDFEGDRYFCTLKKTGYAYTHQCSDSVRTFPTRKTAEKYLEKNLMRLKEFQAKKITRT